MAGKNNQERGAAGEPQGAERRKHPRVKVKLHVMVEQGQATVKAEVVDISLGGAFVELPAAIEPGSEIRLTPILPGRSREEPPVRLEGKVVRVVEYDLADAGARAGAGVEFSGLGARERELLAQIFLRRLDAHDQGDEALKDGAEKRDKDK